MLPGFYGTDGLTRRLRNHLRMLDYRPHGWGLERNHGLTDAIVGRLPLRFEELHQRIAATPPVAV